MTKLASKTSYQSTQDHLRWIGKKPTRGQLFMLYIWIRGTLVYDNPLSQAIRFKLNMITLFDSWPSNLTSLIRKEKSTTTMKLIHDATKMMYTTYILEEQHVIARRRNAEYSLKECEICHLQIRLDSLQNPWPHSYNCLIGRLAGLISVTIIVSAYLCYNVKRRADVVSRTCTWICRLARSPNVHCRVTTTSHH